MEMSCQRSISKLQLTRSLFLMIAAAVALAGLGRPCHAQDNKDWLKKKSSFRSLSKEDEKALFLTLPTVALGQLQAGDILLKKDYSDYATTSPVVKAQKLFRATKGSKYTTHAILYLGSGRVAESIANAPGGVWLRDLNQYGPGASYPIGAHVLIYRCRDRDGATRRALACALALAKDGWTSNGTTKANITYSMRNCFGAFVGNSRDFGPKAQANATAVTNAATGAGPIPFGTFPLKEMMCSEFVTFCYQTGYPQNNPPAIELDAHRTSPIRLEEYLNTHDNFTLEGRFDW